MNRVKSTLLRSSGMRKMLIRVLNMGSHHLFNYWVRLTVQSYSASLAGASGAAAAGAPAAGASPSAAAAAAFFETFSRGTNFFLGLGNSKFSPLRFWAAPPRLVIFSWADLLNQPAATVSFL